MSKVMGKKVYLVEFYKEGEDFYVKKEIYIEYEVELFIDNIICCYKILYKRFSHHRHTLFKLKYVVLLTTCLHCYTLLKKKLSMVSLAVVIA